MNRHEPTPLESVPPPSASGDDGPVPNKLVEQLRSELDAALKRIDDLARAYQASERDREDFKRRMERERERLVDVEKANVAVALLKAVDELDLCLTAATEDSALAKGVRLTRENLLKYAGSTGIERLELLGAAFDPNYAEATDMDVTTSPEEDGTVTQVVRACYQLKGKVVRPGQVKVAKYVKPADA